MDSQKWKCWIRNRVNEAFDQRALFWDQLVIFAAEGHNAGFRSEAGQPCDAVAVQPCTGYKEMGSKGSFCRFDCMRAILRSDLHDFGRSGDCAAIFLKKLSIFGANL